MIIVENTFREILANLTYYYWIYYKITLLLNPAKTIVSLNALENTTEYWKNLYENLLEIIKIKLMLLFLNVWSNL